MGTYGFWRQFGKEGASEVAYYFSCLVCGGFLALNIEKLAHLPKFFVAPLDEYVGPG